MCRIRIHRKIICYITSSDLFEFAENGAWIDIWVNVASRNCDFVNFRSLCFKFLIIWHGHDDGDCDGDRGDSGDGGGGDGGGDGEGGDDM